MKTVTVILINSAGMFESGPVEKLRLFEKKDTSSSLVGSANRPGRGNMITISLASFSVADPVLEA